jgi:peptidoglycan hydrolase-like protein with peptidoglycan-binding domain
VGAHGRHVEALEKRLRALHYYLTGIDDTFDAMTADAVMAFKKVQGLTRDGVVTHATWRALADPYVPAPHNQGPGFHVEVDQTRQVFYAVDGGQITNIIMVSTGADGLTEDGTFHIYKRGGYGREYYPGYFDGARAFHAWPDVPAYAASHGCVRLPFWAAPWYWEHTEVGTDVFIYHS